MCRNEGRGKSEVGDGAEDELIMRGIEDDSSVVVEVVVVVIVVEALETDVDVEVDVALIIVVATPAI
jgi:hypothetical protein